MKLKHLTLIAIFSLGGVVGLVAANAYAHSGRTNAAGCHAGSRPYHCHNGGSSRSSSSSGGSSSRRSTSSSPYESRSSSQTCSPTGEAEPIRAEQKHDYYRNLWIHGNEIQSKVMLLEQPGSEQTSEAHSLVGNFAMASSQYFDTNCTAWVEVFDLSTGYSGWVPKSSTSEQPHSGYRTIPAEQGYRQ